MIKVGVAFSLSNLGLTVNNASKSNVNDNSPKLASTTSPGVCRPTVGYNWRLAYKKTKQCCHGNNRLTGTSETAVPK